MNKSENNANTSESVVRMKRKDYNDIIDQIVDNQNTIDVLTKLINKSGNTQFNPKSIIMDDVKIKTISDGSTSSIFKKKIDSEEQDKKEKHVLFTEVKSEITNQDSSSDEESESESESQSNSSSSSNNNSSSPYRSEADIYQSATTDDGLNKTYRKINREIEYISKKQKGGKMKKREITKRMNFLLDGLSILDKLKRNR